MTATSPTPSTRLPDESVELARHALVAKYGGAKVRIHGPVSVRGNSEIFRATVAAEPPIELALKFCLVHGTLLPDPSMAEAQYAALDRVDRALSRTQSNSVVPAPVCQFPAVGAYAMQWANGRPLTLQLRSLTAYWRGASWFERVGAWIGAFHKAGPLHAQKVDLTDRMRVLNEIDASSLPDTIFLSAVQLLYRQATFLAHLDAHATWLHGDCKTDNFILTDGKVFGIDISLVSENPAEYDVAQFLNNLGLMMVNPLYLHLWPLQHQFESAFWRGYQSTGPSLSRRYLLWLRLNFLLSFWHTELHGKSANLRSKLLNRMFSTLTKRLTVANQNCGDPD